MLVAVISDVHANLAALGAVLDEVTAERPDAIWCLGDVVGYGPEPNRCCALVAAHADLGLAGNHDLGVLGAVDLGEFSPDAAAAARWTASVLSEESRAYLAGLAPAADTPVATLAHGSPRDPIWEYVLTPEAAAAALEDASHPLVLVGHSHVALAIGEEACELAGGLAPAGTVIDLTERRRWLLNPGSVGQPRDGDPRAAWLRLDLDELTATFRRTPYDVSRTQERILALGLPPALAERLATGT